MRLMQWLFGKQSQKGEDIFCDLQVSPEDLSAGLERRITFAREGRCRDCHSRGRRNRMSCAACAGTGRIPETGAVTFSLGPDFLQQAPQNAGEPAFTLRMPGEGHAGQDGGVAGDLYVVIHVVSK
jgi:DnaJ-class molecular chaperone